MRKIISFLLVLMLCASMAGCAVRTPTWSKHPLTVSKEKDAIYYNEQKYINKNFNFIFFDPHYEEDFIQIATIPWPWNPVSYALFGTMDEVYGDDADNPTVIRFHDKSTIWFREDVVLDYYSALTICDSKEFAPFCVAEIITENKLLRTDELSAQAKYQQELLVSFVDCPLMRTSLGFYMIGDNLYLKADMTSYYYEITEEFAAILEQMT